MVLSRSLSTFLFHYVYAMSAIFFEFQGPIYVFVFSYFLFPLIRIIYVFS